MFIYYNLDSKIIRATNLSTYRNDLDLTNKNINRNNKLIIWIFENITQTYLFFDN